MRRICLVTNELYPFAPGGIGRLMHNFRVANEDAGRPVEIHYLFPEHLAAKRAEIEAYLGATAVAHFCSSQPAANDQFRRLAALVDRSHWDFRRTYAEALDYYLGLIEAERAAGGPFDIVEFPDYGGWGYAAILAKQAGLRFQQTCIAVRLHSTFGLISRFETFYHRPSGYAGALCDQERHCLAHADLLVGHLDCIARWNAEHYGFGEEWLRRVRIEFPPILLDPEVMDAAAVEEDAAAEEPTFVFSSRLQPFKRADIFINAAARLARLEPGLRFRARIVSYGWDEEYIGHLRGLVPPDLADRITFDRDLPPAVRHRILETGMIVVPSDYESLCLFAYESGQLGRVVILNRDCSAFGECDRWQDGENCLLFSDDFVGLAEAMRRALSWQPRAPVDATPDTPYWADESFALPGRGAAPVRSSPAVPDAARGRLRIIAYGLDGPEALARFCFRLRQSRLLGAAVSVLMPDQGGAARQGQAALLRGPGWDLVPTTGAELRPAELQAILRGCEEEYVLLLPARFGLYPAFVEAGLRCLDSQPEFALFSALVCRTDDAGNAVGLDLYGGALPSLALGASLVSPPAAMLRREAAIACGFDERARGLWFEEFSRRLVLDGRGAIVVPAALLDCPGQAAAPRTNVLLNATLADRSGMAAGLAHRLIGLELAGPSAAWPSEPFEVIRAEGLANARRAYPEGRAAKWGEPVCFRSDLNALQIHPVEDQLIVAAVRIAPRRAVRMVRCRLRNAHADNAGFEVRVAVAQQEAGIGRLGALDRIEAPGWEVRSEWQFVAAGQSAEITLALPGNRVQPRVVYAATRLRPACSEGFVWAVLDAVELL